MEDLIPQQPLSNQELQNSSDVSQNNKNTRSKVIIIALSTASILAIGTAIVFGYLFLTARNESEKRSKNNETTISITPGQNSSIDVPSRNCLQMSADTVKDISVLFNLPEGWRKLQISAYGGSTLDEASFVATSPDYEINTEGY